RISFYTKFKVAIPDVRGNTLLYLACRHVIIKFRVTRHCVAQGAKKPGGSLQDFGNRVNESFVVARLMPFNMWRNRCQDVLRATMFRQEDFDACSSGFRRLDENKFVFVG